jgi:NAD(P)H dehydrogenase (quinone)
MILVTGATGQLGKIVIEHLLNKTAANQIAALVRDPSKATDLKDKAIDIRVGHYDDISSLDQAMQGIEKVLLISGTDEAHRVQQHQNVVDAAKRAGVQFIAYTSRILKDPEASTNNLMDGHFKTEAIFKQSGLTYALFQNALYMDAIPLFIGGERVFETGIHIPAGEGKVAFALRRDLGEAIANVLLDDASESRIYKLTATEAWSFDDVAAALSELSGKTIEYTPIDRPAFEAQMSQRGLPEQTYQRIADFYGDISDGQLDEVTDELEIVLGRQPSSLKDGLKILFAL